MTDEPGQGPAALPPELNPRGPGVGWGAAGDSWRHGEVPGWHRLQQPAPVPRRRRAARVASWLAVSLAVLLLALTGTGVLLYRHYDGQLTRLPGLFAGSRPAASAADSVNYLLVGSDSREGATKAQLAQEHTTYTDGARTDTMLLVHVSQRYDKALVVSLPRDSWVAIPGHGQGKLNSAFSIGGPKLLIQTVQQLSGVRIDHYVEVGLPGFQRITDAVGGVDVCLSAPAKDSFSGIDLSAGHHHLDGEQALAYVRQRHGLPGGDLGRIHRQQAFLGALLRRATSAGTLLNPVRLNSLLNSVTTAVKVDSSLSFADERTLAARLGHLDPAHVVFATPPVDNADAQRDGQSVVLLDTSGADRLFGLIRDDVDPVTLATPAPAPDAAALTVRPADVRVSVENGSSVSGLGARAAADLRAGGFRVGTTSTARTSVGDQTVVLFGAGQDDAARTVAAAVPGSRMQADDTVGARVVLDVGAGFRGTTPVTVAAPTTAPPPAAPPTAGGVAASASTASDAGCAP